MNICEPFIRRPVMTTLLMLGLLVFGIMGYSNLPVSDLPNVDFPTIQVTASLPGASPDTMATAVATPLEKQLSSIAGLTSMTSQSSLGQTQITLQFTLDRDIDAAAGDVQSAISIASRSLPAAMTTPPYYKKVNPADSPILFLSLDSSTLPLSTVDKYAETLLAQRISMIDGVAQVQVRGSQKYAVRVQVDPDKLAALGIGLDTVAHAISTGNSDLPTGTLNGAKQGYFIEANGQLADAAAYRPLIVSYTNGAPVYLNSVANIIDSVENNQIASWINGQRGIMLAIYRQPGTNTIQIINNIKAILPAFEQQMPVGIHLGITYDRSTSIRASIDDVLMTLAIAAALVVLVIFVFLRNFYATLIPSIALPISIIGTFALMDLAGFSINNISLLGLTLAVGYVVDDAIVMLENIYRHMEHGESAFTAALRGSKEIGFTILSITISLVAVFVPILFMSGIVGRLFHEFAVTISLAILLSGIISLTLTPMLCSRALKSPQQQRHYRWFDRTERVFQNVLNYYDRSLLWILAHRRFTLGLFFCSLAAAAYLFYAVPKDFLPSEDTGMIFAFTEADAAVSFEAMTQRQLAVADIIQKDPNVKSVISTVGAGGPNSTANTGQLILSLKPLNQRKLSADEIIQELRKKLTQIPGITTYLQNMPSIRVGGRLTKSTYQFTLQDADVNELNKWAVLLTQKLATLPQLQDLTNDLQFSGPQIIVNIDRNKASALGVSAAQIENTLSDAFGTRQVSTILTNIDSYEVIMELAPQFQQNPSALSKIYVTSQSGTLVPLAALTTITRGVGPLTVNHQGQLPAVTISFNLPTGESLGTAVAVINKAVKDLHPPQALNTSFQGSAQTFQKSLTSLGLLTIIAIFVIYIVLGILYESFIHPLTILSGLPSAAVGALLTLILFHNTLNLYSFIGIIMLLGIVKKNAIMMIDFAIDAQRNENKAPLEAIYQACLIRFRPIMMTTLAALMGALPIALAIGAGSESRRPLGLAVVGGLIFSQFLTLYITPVLYLYLEGFSQRYGFKKTGKTSTPAN